MRILALVLLMALAALPGQAERALSVTATGVGFVGGPADRDAARRRALADALVAAALQGGASLRGISAQSMGRMIRDLTILRPAARVVSHRVVAETLQGDTWSITIQAVVAPLEARACGQGRTLILTAMRPRTEVRPEAPAFAAALADRLAAEIMDTLHRHPRIALDRVTDDRAANAGRVLPAAVDYTALTRGEVRAAPGDHGFGADIRIDLSDGALRLRLTLTVEEPGGTIRTRDIQRTAPLPRGNAVAALAGRTRDRAASDLSRGVAAEVADFLDRLACEAPSARMVWTGQALEIPLGRRHGLTRGSLAVIDDAEQSVDILTISDLGGERATLAPLDPGLAPQSLDGRAVYLLETGQ